MFLVQGLGLYCPVPELSVESRLRTKTPRRRNRPVGNAAAIPSYPYRSSQTWDQSASAMNDDSSRPWTSVRAARIRFSFMM